jgi:type I restriction enzyme, R subunit
MITDNERVTQNRVIKLFRNELQYDYLGNWEDRPDNTHIEKEYLEKWLLQQGYEAEIIQKAIFALQKETNINAQEDLYNINMRVYNMLRYGTPQKSDITGKITTVYFIDWKNPQNNHFGIAQEVTIKYNEKNRRPDIVLYINGIVIGVIELKRAGVSVSEGIRQNISNQTNRFNKPFFTTIQFVLAGNDSQGLHYGTTKTSEKYFLTWKEENQVSNPNELLLDTHLKQFCEKGRLLDIMHNFVIFDNGTKKLCRPHQYFGTKSAQQYLTAGKGGIIWHTQGSGKSLTMAWLTKWILENKPNARVLIVTDRTELDNQIEGVFKGIGENITRSRSGGDLLEKLNQNTPRILCSLIHKFGRKDENNITKYVEELKLPKDFSPKGDFVVFVDECHRTQSGELHKAMKDILPKNTIYIGFTGTPLLKRDKKNSLEIFGSYIHTYKFDEAVKDKVVLGLLYEARDIDQRITNQNNVDDFFEKITKGMNPLPQAELKAKWGTMQKVLSVKSRLEKIVYDIQKDFVFKSRLSDGRGNAMLVARSIYDACRYYELFQETLLKGKCAIITSYVPNENDLKLEDTGEGETEKKEQFGAYQKMLAHFGYNNSEDFEQFAKDKFKNEPANMSLLIVVDKLLTGFDAIHCTYLYIDKEMRDHGLFQAICRTNRLGKEEENDPYYKEFGYIIDYKNLFQQLNHSITDYTSDAFDAFDEEDVRGLITDRLQMAKQRLQDALEALHTLCFNILAPQKTKEYFVFFCGDNSTEQLKEKEEKRKIFYDLVVSLVRAFNNIKPEMEKAGYTETQIQTIQRQVNDYIEMRDAIKNHSADYIDMKQYEPRMRQMLDMYLTAEESKNISDFGEATLLEIIIKDGINNAITRLPNAIRQNREAINETIENNMRRTIIQEMPTNPIYYEKMGKLLADLILLRKGEAITYQELLQRYNELAQQIQPQAKRQYPPQIDTPAKQALFDNLQENVELAIKLDANIKKLKDDDWRNTIIKKRGMENIIIQNLKEWGITDPETHTKIFEIVYNQRDY